MKVLVLVFAQEILSMIHIHVRTSNAVQSAKIVTLCTYICLSCVHQCEPDRISVLLIFQVFGLMSLLTVHLVSDPSVSSPLNWMLIVF